MASRILFVDDERNVLNAYQRMLRSRKSEWQMEFVDCPIKAWQMLQEQPFDVVVSDIRMPGMTGLQLLDRITTDQRTDILQVIIVTGESDQQLKSLALNQGAADLLNKPILQEDLIARLKSVIRIREYADRLKQQNEQLETRVRERTAALNASRIDTLWRLGKAAEYRDEETGNHVIRVGSYSRVIAEAMGLDDEFCDTLFLAAPLHDIGKIGIPDSVLLKPGKLTAEEWEMMRRHCEIGVAILSNECKFMDAVSRYASDVLEDSKGAKIDNPVIELATIIAETHHEKWNGSGYPNALVGAEIPLPGRIVAIADVYDALRSERPYKQPFSVEKSLDILSEEAGAHFDPDVVEAFFAAFDQIREIEQEFRDVPEATAILPCVATTLSSEAQVASV